MTNKDSRQYNQEFDSSSKVGDGLKDLRNESYGNYKSPNRRVKKL